MTIFGIHYYERSNLLGKKTKWNKPLQSFAIGIDSAGCNGLTDQYIIEQLEENLAIAARFAAADTGFGKQANRVYNLAKEFFATCTLKTGVLRYLARS